MRFLGRAPKGKTISSSEGIFHEDPLNAATHAIGLWLAAMGVGAIIAKEGTAQQEACAFVYACCLLTVYLSSFLYHVFPFGDTKRTLRIFDHQAIFLLLAGSYFPIALLGVGGRIGGMLAGGVLLLSLLGMLLTARDLGRYARRMLLLRLGIGWSALLLLPFFQGATPADILALVGGGALYTLGIFFFRASALPHHHAIWHLFVIGGSLWHYLLIFSLV